MEKELTREVVEKLVGWLDSAGDFVVDQAPDVVQQLLLFGVWDSLFGIMYTTVVLTIVVVVYRKIATTERLEYAEGFELVFGYSLFLLAVSVPLFLMFLSILEIIKIYFTPKLYILERLSGLI